MSYFLDLWGKEKDFAMYISLRRWKPFTLHVVLLGDFAMSSHLCSPEKVFLKGLYPAKDSGGTFLKMSQTLHRMTLSEQHANGKLDKF